MLIQAVVNSGRTSRKGASSTRGVAVVVITVVKLITIDTIYGIHG